MRQPFDGLTLSPSLPLNYLEVYTVIVNEISGDVSQCRNIKTIRDKRRAEFESEFADLLRGVELGTKNLTGACDQCLHLYEAEEIPRLQPLLSQIK